MEICLLQIEQDRTSAYWEDLSDLLYGRHLEAKTYDVPIQSVEIEDDVSLSVPPPPERRRIGYER